MKLKHISFAIFFLFSCKQKELKNNTQIGISADTTQRKHSLLNADISPMDMSWCPVNYPLAKMENNITQKLIARVIYSRPHKNRRQIFGDTPKSLCQYGKPWRLGANEATEITFFENVLIADKNIAKGTYILYCIPKKDKWQVILNNNLYTWGLHIDSSKDVFKTEIPVISQAPIIEDFTMLFEENNTGANLIMAWDNVKTVLPIVFKK
ncbi:MAG: DUF2911 domain-containing protein [Ferruginibacter sp.]|nr:DUF2911 domain-containing protein [Ferruginibacter sp.]